MSKNQSKFPFRDDEDSTPHTATLLQNILDGADEKRRDRERDQAEEEVLGADVVVVEAVRFLAGERQHLLGARREVVHWFHEVGGKAVTWRRY